MIRKMFPEDGQKLSAIVNDQRVADTLVELFIFQTVKVLPCFSYQEDAFIFTVCE